MINTKNTKADHASYSQRGLSTPVVAVISCLIALSARAADITVTRTADIVNGDVANPTALITNPGPDGISLREAILAANNAVGPHTINFAPELAGQTITPTSPLIVAQNGVTLAGLCTSDGQPNITLDGGGFGSLFAVLFVHASDFTMTGFRIIRVPFNGINIRAGRNVDEIFPQAIRNIRIENNMFDNTDTTVPISEAIRVYMEPEGMSVNATIENVRIARNTFLRYVNGGGVIVQANGTNCMIRDVVIEGNTFVDMWTSVDVSTATGSNNRVVDTRIIGNTFQGGFGPPMIFIGHMVDPLPNFENHVDSTVVFGNVYSGNLSSFVAIVGGQFNASRNVVSNTQVVNNLILAEGGIDIIGGKLLAAGNRVEGVRIINNTVISDVPGLRIYSNVDNSTGNSITGVDALNTIFSGPGGGGFRGEVTPDQFHFCFTSQEGFAGINGNISADPLFVDPSQGDYHLQASSPCIDAGDNSAIPAGVIVDLDGNPRIINGIVDMGAYEGGMAPIPDVYYVDDDATGANDGSSWADAYWCLQDALAAGQYGDEIRVAQGTYKPDQRVTIGRGGLQIITSSGDRTETLQLINGVSVKGGYAGFGEPDPDARDIEAYETILSGNLNGDDMPVANPSDLMDEPTRAENSFHVVTGSRTGETAVLDGFTITAGNANGSNPNNKGGGMYCELGSPTISNCTFNGNSANAGGGMRNNNSSPSVANCTFRGNSANNNGGGIHNYGSHSNITNCTFSENSAKSGGGMRNGINSSPTVTNCTFSENSAEYGGGMYNNRSSSPTVTNCTFSSNLASSGGAIYNESSSLNVINCILWGDTPEEIYGSTPGITYSDVQGGWPGEGNIDADPLFVDAANADYHLQAGSPCIDAGDNSAIPAGVIVDLDGNPRIINGIVDMGAYEGGMAPPLADSLAEVLDTALSFTTGGND